MKNRRVDEKNSQHELLLFLVMMLLLSGLGEYSQLHTMAGLDNSVEILKDTLGVLEGAVAAFQRQTADVPQLQEALHSKMLFNVLPERIVLQRPLKIRKVIKPLVEKDKKTLGELLSKYKNRRQVLEQQSKILKLKLETLGN